jgi:hypothetical protein
MENKEIIDKYIEFNIEQIMPILLELKLAKNITEELIIILKNYKDFLQKINDKNENLIKNCDFVCNQIKLLIYKQNPIKKINSKKDTIFDRINRGLLYRYKIKNNIIAENPEYLMIDKFVFADNCINIGNNNIEIFNFNGENNNDFLKKKNLNIINTQIIIAELDIILMQIINYINIINDDVIHFKLFDQKYLLM